MYDVVKTSNGFFVLCEMKQRSPKVSPHCTLSLNVVQLLSDVQRLRVTLNRARHVAGIRIKDAEVIMGLSKQRFMARRRGELNRGRGWF
jgi:hypothetical protein